jgi:hypothetical protein
VEEQDFDKTAKVRNPQGVSYLPTIDQLTTDTALLRRIAYNTNVIRLVLIWTLVIVPIVLLAIAIPVIVLSAHANTPSSISTSNCSILYSTC